MKENNYTAFCTTCCHTSGSIFSKLGDAELAKLGHEKSVNHYKKGDFIYREGNKVNGIYCILQGNVKIYKTGSEARHQVIKFAKPGDIMAYRSVLSGELACTTAQAIEAVSVCYIPGKTIFELINGNPVFSTALLRLVCIELNEANNLITDIAQKNARERLAEVLLNLSDYFGTDSNGYINIVLTREDFANAVGSATEPVIRLLTEFKNKGFVELKGKKIKICDPKSLKNIGL